MELHTSVSKKRASLSSSNNKYAERQFSVYCGKKSILVVRCEEAEETQDWVAALQDTKLLCSNRKKVSSSGEHHLRIYSTSLLSSYKAGDYKMPSVCLPVAHILYL